MLSHRMARTVVTAGAILICSAPAAADEVMPRTVAVSGTGYATTVPDMARIDMSVVERNESLRVAQQAAGQATGRVLELLDRLKIERKYINTTGASIRPEYKWDKQRNEQQLTGYVVERRISVELRDLEKLGPLIEQVTATGVNQLSPPQMDSTRRREVYRQALTNAYNDARANAVTLAAAAGATLGAVLSINSGATPIVPQPRMRLQAEAVMADSGAESSYVPGEIRFNANVSAVYALAGK